MTDQEAVEFLVAALGRIYAPRSGLNAWQWGERHVTLDSRESIDFQGRWDSSLNPYVRFVCEFITDDYGENVDFAPGFPREGYEELIIMKSSQLGLTLALLICLAYWIAEVKQNALYAINSMEEVRKISIARLQPLLKACAPTAEALEESEDKQSNLTLFLNSLAVYLLGAHGKGAFRNKSVGLAILDELDAYPLADAEDSSPLDNARARLKAVEGGKLITSSSPETTRHPTAQEEKTGSRHRPFLRCPYCGHYQEPTWDKFTADHCRLADGTHDRERVLVDTRLRCEMELCGRLIPESEKPGMLASMRIRQTNPAPLNRRKLSLHLSDVISPFKKAGWGVLMLEYLDAQGNPAALANFRKNRLGLPAELQESSRQPSQIYRLCDNYLRGTLPVEPCLVTLTSDVQGDVKKWVKCGFRPSGEMWVIDWGACLSFEELALVANDIVPVGNVRPSSDLVRFRPDRDKWDGLSVRAAVGLIDEGYITSEVREFCQRQLLGGGWQVWPAKGRGGIQVRLTVQESLAEALGLAIKVYHFSDDDIKKLLYIGLIERRLREVPGAPPGPPIHFPSRISSDFVRELCSERLQGVAENGVIREKWIKDSKTPNDWGDALKLSLVIWHVLAPMFTDWQPSF